MAVLISEEVLDPTPVSVPLISQSIDSRNSSGRFSSDSPSGSPAPEAPDWSSSSSPRLPRQLGSQSQPLTRVEEYRHLFRLPPDELRVEEFFNLFSSDGSVSFHESFHTKCGDKDFKCTKWHPYENFWHTREVSFQHPIKIYFGARFGSCQEVQKYRVYRNSHLIIDTSQDISDVPYADYFSVKGSWDVKPEGNDDSKPGCTLSVYTNVAFSKKTMWKGKIVQSTIEECREAYAIWIRLAHEVLKQKNLEKEEDKHHCVIK